MRRYLLVVQFVVCSLALGSEPKVIFEEDSSLLISSFRVIVQSGSANDPSGKSGLNNLMAELMLRGTKKRNRGKFQSELEKMGAAVGVATSHDQITFHGSVIKENTDRFLALLEECLVQPALDKKEFAALKTEVLAEQTNIKNQNNRLGGIAIRREVFAGTPLANPTNGSVATLNNITWEDVQWAYNNQFHRGNIFFGVASPYKEADIKKTLTKIWLRFPDGARHATKSIALKIPKTPNLIVVHKPKTKTGSIILLQAGITAKDPDRYQLGVGNFSFGGEPLVSRLFKTVRSELGWTYSINSGYNAMGGLSHQQGFFAIGSTPAVEFTGKTILKILAMWKEYTKKGLDKEEMLLAQESIVNSYPFEFDSAQKRLGRKIDSYLYDVPILSPEEYKKTITAIDNKKIIEALARKHSESGWWIGVVADKDEVAKQLAEEQKEIPEAQRLSIAKVVAPDEVIEQVQRKVLKVD